MPAVPESYKVTDFDWDLLLVLFHAGCAVTVHVTKLGRAIVVYSTPQIAG